MTHLIVLRSGPRTTVQDAGRFGLAHLGLPAAGPVDRSAWAAAHAVVGNQPTAAALEVTLGGLAVEADDGDVVIGVRGAAVTAEVDGRGVALAGPVRVPAGSRFTVSRATSGLYCYVAVRGGIDVPAVLGSRSTDTLSKLGPAQVADGDRLTVGTVRTLPSVQPAGEPRYGEPVRLSPGPHGEQLPPGAFATLLQSDWEVTTRTDRTAARLQGEPIDTGGVSIRSEALVDGAVQLPPDGQPIVFLANRPTTGGYPVLGVVVSDDLPLVAQSRPGNRLRFRAVQAS